MEKNEIPSVCPLNRAAWRTWLAANHETASAVWLVYYKKKARKTNFEWSDAVDEALCFGWIDSVRKTLDEDRFIQFFSKRKSKSVWSKINKDKIEQLIAKGLMMPAGYTSIAVAQENGSWNILDEVEDLTVPKDLEKAFQSQAGSAQFFIGLSKSAKKSMLQWIILAKQAATRQKRIDELVTLAAQGLKPKQFR